MGVTQDQIFLAIHGSGGYQVQGPKWDRRFTERRLGPAQKKGGLKKQIRYFAVVPSKTSMGRNQQQEQSAAGGASGPKVAPIPILKYFEDEEYSTIPKKSKTKPEIMLKNPTNVDISEKKKITITTMSKPLTLRFKNSLDRDAFLGKFEEAMKEIWEFDVTKIE